MAKGRTQIRPTIKIQVLLARHFRVATIAASHTTTRTHGAAKSRSAIRPHHHIASIPGFGRVCFNLCASCHDRLLRIGYASVATVPAAAHQHFATAHFSTGIQDCRTLQQNLVGGDVNDSTQAIRAQS